MSVIIDIFLRFLRLGCTSFGGPVAHIGYFRHYFVKQLNWLDEQEYAALVALSQFLPGPGSSQVGFAIGLKRGGTAGGIAAFLGFTLPSFVLLYLLAIGASSFASSPVVVSLIHALKLLAVVVVADATLGMYRNFCQQRWSLCVMAGTAALLLLFPGIGTQLLLLIIAAACGLLLNRSSLPPEVPSPALQRPRMRPTLLFLILALLPALLPTQPLIELFQRFYTAGTLVFGGGHVVLPLLQDLVGDQLSPDHFLLGYSAAQAVPGPMFTLAAFLGAELQSDHSLGGALIATLALFLPGLLLVAALHDGWQRLRQQPQVAGAVQGINAAVVGLLLAALYNPVFSNAVATTGDMAWVILGMVALRGLKWGVMPLIFAFAMIGLIQGGLL